MTKNEVTRISMLIKEYQSSQRRVTELIIAQEAVLKSGMPSTGTYGMNKTYINKSTTRSFEEFRTVYACANEVMGDRNLDTRPVMIRNIATQYPDRLKALVSQLEESRSLLGQISEEVMEVVPETLTDAVLKLDFVCNLVHDGAHIEHDYLAWIIGECIQVINQKVHVHIH